MRDYLVGADEDGLRNSDAARLRRAEIDDRRWASLAEWPESGQTRL